MTEDIRISKTGFCFLVGYLLVNENEKQTGVVLETTPDKRLLLILASGYTALKCYTTFDVD